ncbi:ABC transporter ATP-binding protein [Oceanobacillus damuensis]|uniref:ABC transporter ATP-binding protein n=1 Tax=Oceanobacillus damuensis TaxID=937928 RepID=UPI00082F5479|nr:oligopeptide/dipeptide ABC transporter ATP-binding protein [Oceanobacillus damuensis]
MNDLIRKNDEILLELKNVKKYYDISNSFLKNKSYLKAVDDISLRVRKGETIGIVGESGCGKSTLGNLIMQMLPLTEGQILFEGEDMSNLSANQLRKKRLDFQMIFQDPFSSLNPRMKVLDIIAEPLRTYRIAKGEELENKVYSLMDLVGLNKSQAYRYPHEFSGGQRQRIGIARALALNPKLIVCDEPISALDVSIQAQILNLLSNLQKKLGLTYIFIGHGIPAVKYISDRIAVMYMGKIVEIADKNEIVKNPKHPYTEALLSAIPVPDPKLRGNKKQTVIEGDVPNPVNPPSGCRFHTRCLYAEEKCKREEPQMKRLHSYHQFACHYPINHQGGKEFENGTA